LEYNAGIATSLKSFELEQQLFILLLGKYKAPSSLLEKTSEKRIFCTELFLQPEE